MYDEMNPNGLSPEQYQYFLGSPKAPVKDSALAASSYSVPSLAYPPSGSYSAPRPYTPSLKTGPFLDALASDLAPKVSQDPIDNFFTGKQMSLSREIRDIAGLIYEREALKEVNHLEIDQEYCGVKTNLFQLEWITLGVNPQLDKVRLGLEQQLRMLDSDKRREEIECWRDVVRLKGDLREICREFGQEQRKTALLSDTPYTPWK